MKFFVLAVLPALVAAQYGPPPDSSSAAPAASGSAAASAAAAVPSAGPGQHIVQVAAGGQLVFQPSSITAKENETVTFLFPTSGGFMHSVTQSSFANPCTLLANGFDSGLQPNGMQFTITITNASAPIWFYCKQTAPLMHCAKGMVGGINVPTAGNKTIENFTAAAMALGANEPPQTASGGLTGVGAAATAAAGPAAAAAAGASGTGAPAASGSAATKSSGERLVVTAGSLLIGVFAAIYTLA